MMDAVNTKLTPRTPVHYSTHEAALMAGVSYRMLDHWLRSGAIRPDWDPHPGSGFFRRWSPEDVDRLCEVVSNWRNAEAVIRDFRSGRLWEQLAER
jgi:DNA-binding transcriptional MerR regulator